MAFERLDRDQILADCDPIEVAEACGLRVDRRTHAITCPVHEKIIGKKDRHVGNCRITDKGFYCQACKGKGSIIDLVMETQNVNFPAALTFIADLTAGSSEMYKMGTYKKKNSEEHIDNCTADFLGLNGKCRRKRWIPDVGNNLSLINCTYSYEEAKTLKEDGYTVIPSMKEDESDMYLIYERMPSYSLAMLKYEDPEVYEEMVINKKKEKEEFLSDWEEYIETIIDKELYQSLKKALNEEKSQLRKI